MLLLRLIRESYLFALQSVFANKLRTLLTILGITIGIFSIIIVFTVVDSMKNKITDSIESLGSDVIFVQKWPWSFSSDYPWWKYLKRPTIKLEDLEEIENRSQTMDVAVFMAQDRKSVETKDTKLDDINISGVTQDYNRVFSFDIADGRYISRSEFDNGVPVCMLGAEIADQLFPQGNAIDQSVRIANLKVRVIGQIQREGSGDFGNSHDQTILVPVNFLRNITDIRSDQAGSFIAVKSRKGIPKEELQYELTGIMRSIHRIKPSSEDDFAINEPSLITQGFEGIFSAVSLAGWFIGGFALLVGGFGIANIMFVSVRERTSQIGIQKALGAKRYFVLLEFLIEAVFLSVFGGFGGLLLVWIVTLLATYGAGFDLSLTTGNIVLGVLVSAFIGLVAGLIPAWFAARLDPVEAIRQN